LRAVVLPFYLLLGIGGGAQSLFAQSAEIPKATEEKEGQPPKVSVERQALMAKAPFAGLFRTQRALQQLALDMQLVDYCLDPQVSDAELAPLLAEAARLSDDEPTCTALFARLGYLERRQSGNRASERTP
jgi:hypothetical protein